MRPGALPAGVGGLALAAALAALAPGGAEAQDWLEMSTARQASGEDRVSVRVVYGAGRLDVGPADEGLLYRARMRYDSEVFRPLREFERAGDGARVRLGVMGREGRFEMDFDWKSLELSPLDLDDLDLRGLDESDAGDMSLGISRTVPTDLDVRVGAARSTMELGGLPLVRLRIATGASETLVDFDRPNPASMEALEVKAGAASLEMRGLGNAAAERISIQNAVGEVTLDFSGEWSRDASAEVETGLGTVTLRIPGDLGVKLTKSSVLSSFSGLGLRKEDDGSYRSENWDEADHRLELEVNAAFGSIEVERLR